MSLCARCRSLCECPDDCHAAAIVAENVKLREAATPPDFDKAIRLMDEASPSDKLSPRQMNALAEIIGAWADENAQLRALVQEAEGAAGDSVFPEMCPWCGAYLHNDDETIVHRPDCKAAAVMGWRRK